MVDLGTARSLCLSTLITVLLLRAVGMSKAGVGLFVLRLLLLFIFLPLEESIWSYEHLIEEKIGEAICNQLYTARDAHASFKRPGKYDAPYAEQWHILKLGEYNSLRI